MYAQVDHRFCRRWAVLTDPEETLGASGAGVKVKLYSRFPRTGNIDRMVGIVKRYLNSRKPFTGLQKLY